MSEDENYSTLVSHLPWEKDLDQPTRSVISCSRHNVWPRTSPKRRTGPQLLKENEIRMVLPFATAHTFCAFRDGPRNTREGGGGVVMRTAPITTMMIHQQFNVELIQLRNE